MDFHSFPFLSPCKFELTIRFPQYQELDPGEYRINIFDHLISCAKRGKSPGELYYPNGITVDPDTNYIYVAEGDKLCNFARVSIFSELGEYISSFTHKCMKSLWGIAIHKNNIYVTDTEIHAVFHLKLDTDLCLVAMLGSRGSGIGQFNKPRQLSVSTNGDVYIADYGNDRLQILVSSLHPIEEITHPSMHRPLDVKLTTEVMYVLSEIDSPSIHVFSYTGRIMRSVSICDEGMRVPRAFCFCLDGNKGLIISDLRTHQIKFFSKEGVLLHTLGEEGHEFGMFYLPTGLARTSSLKLVTVSRNENFRLQIFSFQ